MHIQSPARSVVLVLLLFPVCAFSQITVSPASGSGVTNTGNAAVGDVASGKTFSSSVLTNATGTSTKNATVPNDAAILPAQAFVNCTATEVLEAISTDITLDWSNRGITSVNASATGLLKYADNIIATVSVHGLRIDLSGNAITNTNAILAILVAGGHANGILYLSGGTTVAPTGQGITDANTLTIAGWDISTN